MSRNLKGRREPGQGSLGKEHSRRSNHLVPKPQGGTSLAYLGSQGSHVVRRSVVDETEELREGGRCPVDHSEESGSHGSISSR